MFDNQNPFNYTPTKICDLLYRFQIFYSYGVEVLLRKDTDGYCDRMSIHCFLDMMLVIIFTMVSMCSVLLLVSKKKYF